MNVDPGFMRGHTIASFLALNNGPGPEGHGRNYPQTSFEDPYVRITENNLRDLLYASDNPQCRADMRTVFGQKEQCHELSYSLFIERTRHAKTTVSMEAAAGMPYFDMDAPHYDDNMVEFYHGPKGMDSTYAILPRFMSVHFFCT
jgi:hypothetical protein